MLRRMMMAGGGGPEPPAGALWDAAKKTPLVVISEGGARVHRAGTGTAVASPRAAVRAAVGHNAGKWYFEIESPVPDYYGNAYESAGLIAEATPVDESLYVGLPAGTWGFCFRRTGGGTGVQEVRSGAETWVYPELPTMTPGWIGVAVDADAGMAWAVINGDWVFGLRPDADGGRFTFPPGTRMYPAITIASGIESDPLAHYTLNTGQMPFKVGTAAFGPGGTLAGFNAGW